MTMAILSTFYEPKKIAFVQIDTNKFTGIGTNAVFRTLRLGIAEDGRQAAEGFFEFTVKIGLIADAAPETDFVNGKVGVLQHLPGRKQLLLQLQLGEGVAGFIFQHIAGIRVIVIVLPGDFLQGAGVIVIVDFPKHRGQYQILLAGVGGIHGIHFHHTQMQKHHAYVFIQHSIESDASLGKIQAQKTFHGQFEQRVVCAFEQQKMIMLNRLVIAVHQKAGDNFFPV